MERVEKDYEELLRLFNKHKVKYCLVGAFAVAFYSIPRYTKDMDIFIEATLENGKRIVRALHDFGFSSLKLSEKDFSEKGKTIQLGYEPIRIDLVTSIDGCDFARVWKYKKRGRYGEQPVFFIGFDDLVKNKKASARKQDLTDLENLNRPPAGKIRKRAQGH